MQWNCHFCTTKVRHVFVQILLGLILTLTLGLIFGFFVMLLWNPIVPDLFGFHIITYWQSVGLVIILRLLFGGHHNYHKQPNQEAARCKTHFSKLMESCQHTNSESAHVDYETWWEEEGKISLEKYIKDVETKK